MTTETNGKLASIRNAIVTAIRQKNEADLRIFYDRLKGLIEMMDSEYCKQLNKKLDDTI